MFWHALGRIEDTSNFADAASHGREPNVMKAVQKPNRDKLRLSA
jgi:hypothetical protein